MFNTDLSRRPLWCGGGRRGFPFFFHADGERPHGGQFGLFADLPHLWLDGCVCREAAHVHHGFFSLGGPSLLNKLHKLPLLKKEAYEKEEIEA